MSASGFDRLRQRVVGDPVLEDRLLAAPDRIAFVATAVALGTELGLPVEAADVQAAVDAGRRSWYATWI